MITDKELANLSVDERIRLIAKIWDTLRSESFSLSPEQQAELDRRMSRIQQGETKFYSWEEIQNDFQP